MQIIDSHFHLYKSEQAGLMAQGGESLIGFCGTFEEAVPILDHGRISKIIALAVIPISPMRQAAMKKWPRDITPSKRHDLSKELDEKMLKRLTGFNDWLCRVAREDGRIEPVIAADATISKEKMAAEILSKLESYRIKALKIHPAVNSLSPAYQGYQHIFELAQEKNLIVISHGGISGNDTEGKYCSPINFRKVLDRFPKLKLVVAHLAFPHVKSLLELASQYPNLYTDLSFVLRNSPLTDEVFCEVIRSFGPDRVFFGSDFPWSDPEKDIDRLLKLNLSDNELEMVAWQNAASILALAG